MFTLSALDDVAAQIKECTTQVAAAKKEVQELRTENSALSTTVHQLKKTHTRDVTELRKESAADKATLAVLTQLALDPCSIKTGNSSGLPKALASLRVCPKGFKCHSLGAFKFDCKDIDECQETPNGGCKGVGKCQNTHGSFTCVCPSGYTYNTKTLVCDDIDECTETGKNPCLQGYGMNGASNPSRGTCVNVKGRQSEWTRGFYCKCPSKWYQMKTDGYSLDGMCFECGRQDAAFCRSVISGGHPCPSAAKMRHWYIVGCANYCYNYAQSYPECR